MNRQHIIPQILLRSWPFPRGAGRLIDRFFSSISFDNEIETVRTTDGFEINVMPNDLIGRHLYLTGEFDRTTVEVLCRFANPGDTLLDIGANIGYISACFLQNVPGSQAIAVEPQPGVIDLLKQNAQQFGNRCQVYPYAISDRDGEAFFSINPLNRGASSIADTGVRIETRSADTLIRETSAARIDIVKVDVEGHEEQVFRSCRPMLARFNPRAILFEDHGTKAAGAIGAILAASGYEIFGVVKRLTKIDLRRISNEGDCTCNDYVAVKH